ncbi:MAG: AmmeMemoRadiSam system protein B [Terriglobales bacterium]
MLRRVFCLVIIVGVVLPAACAAQKSAEQVRPPAVAGAFYPGDAKELAATVDAFVASAKPPEIGGQLVALISPHAGYPYSGAVAGHGYALLKGRKYTRVVVLAPSHHDAFEFASVYDGDYYSTPLGRIPVDKDFARRLAAFGPAMKLSSRAHTDSKEHSLEVQLPFLQRVLGDLKLVPVIMGTQDYDSSRSLGVALARLIQNNDALIVASSDLSHFHPYDEAVKLDRKTLNALTGWDYFSASRNFERRVWEACGGGPVVAAMIAAERLGANDVRLLKYANSGDVTADRLRVVGYGSLAVVRVPGLKPVGEPSFSLTSREREELLKLARKSVETAVRDKKLYEPPPVTLDALAQERGAFVTLKEKGQLRGCIGYTSAFTPLYLTVRDVAAFAAVRDTRFAPVRASELPELEYEISVLSPLRRVTDIKQIQVGRHGLLMKNGQSEGILLPQVPTELGWDRKTFLEETCEKAGMQRNCWQDPDTDMFMFTALVFEEHKLAPSTFDDQRPPTPDKPGPHLPPR